MEAEKEWQTKVKTDTRFVGCLRKLLDLSQLIFNNVKPYAKEYAQTGVDRFSSFYLMYRAREEAVQRSAEKVQRLDRLRCEFQQQYQGAVSLSPMYEAVQDNWRIVNPQSLLSDNNQWVFSTAQGAQVVQRRLLLQCDRNSDAMDFEIDRLMMYGQAFKDRIAAVDQAKEIYRKKKDCVQPYVPFLRAEEVEHTHAQKEAQTRQTLCLAVARRAENSIYLGKMLLSYLENLLCSSNISDFWKLEEELAFLAEALENASIRADLVGLPAPVPASSAPDTVASVSI